MKQLYVLCGVSFSGKTTLGSAIRARHPCAYLSTDEINRERGLPFGGEGLPVERWEETLEIALGRLSRLMDSGQDVLLDDTNCYRWLRDRYREVAATNGYESTVLYLDVPLAELVRRRLQNELSGERERVSDEIFESHYETFEAPRSDEALLTLRPEDSVEDWLSRHFG
jgi:predicted kinase